MRRALPVLLLAFGMLLTACGAVTPAPVATEPATQAPVAAPTATAMPAGLLTYHDAQAGFSFDYPDTWTLKPVTPGDRASGVQLVSWKPVTGQPEGVVPPGGSSLDVLVQLWDPKGDLAAFTAQRKSAWDGSQIKILSADDVTLADGRAAHEFVVQGSDGAQGYFLLTTLGDKYLVASGSGDLEQLGRIARSLR